MLVETQSGLEVCAEAENGQEAIAKVKECKPDLIIMDMAMPVKDGITASRELSTMMPRVPIVMHTLHYSPELELEAKKAGVRKVVPKADSGDGLLCAIAEILQEHASGTLVDAGNAATEASSGTNQEQPPAPDDANNSRCEH